LLCCATALSGVEGHHRISLSSGAAVDMGGAGLAVGLLGASFGPPGPQRSKTSFAVVPSGNIKFGYVIFPDMLSLILSRTTTYS
jgi:hypothetical protein